MLRGCSRARPCTLAVSVLLSGLLLAPAAHASDEATDSAVDGLSSAWRGGKGAVAPDDAGAVRLLFGESQPSLKCKVLNICAIRLRPGEVLTEAPTVGDAVRWSVAVRAGGNGRDKVVYIVVKPASTAETTSMFITTNERAYHIELTPAGANEESYTPLLTFTYPEDVEAENRARVMAMQREADVEAREADRRAIEVGGRRIPADELDFAYRIRGSAEFKPARVFNDGERTYIDLPDSYTGELPLFIATGVSGDEVVNYRVSGQRYIIDKVVPGGQLTLGVGSKSATISIRRAQ